MSQRTLDLSEWLSIAAVAARLSGGAGFGWLLVILNEVQSSLTEIHLILFSLFGIAFGVTFLTIIPNLMTRRSRSRMRVSRATANWLVVPQLALMAGAAAAFTFAYAPTWGMVFVALITVWVVPGTLLARRLSHRDAADSPPAHGQ